MRGIFGFHCFVFVCYGGACFTRCYMFSLNIEFCRIAPGIYFPNKSVTSTEF